MEKDIKNRNNEDENDEGESREMKLNLITNSKQANQHLVSLTGKPLTQKPNGSNQASPNTSGTSLQLQTSESEAITGTDTKNDKKGLFDGIKKIFK
ncbi:unnamed protein product [Chironomus riparius]|uniref:Uncharacterized protein n=1 Tax=Chironomus riparius TaxID=315576 RepID=A0A9N9RRF7_9DIPT|nr:unnamed protein product [Chironomus riparius]